MMLVKLFIHTSTHKMFAIKHFYTSILPTMLLSLLFAIFPMYPSKNNGTIHLNSSRHLQLLTVTQITVFVTLLASVIMQRASGITSGKYYKGYKVSNVGIAFEFAGGIIYLVIAYICSFFKTQRVKETVEVLNFADTVLERLGEKFNYTRDFIYQIVLLIFGNATILLLVNLQRLNMYREGFKPLSVTVWVVFIIPLLVTNTMNSQFAFTVTAIRNRFKKINQQLKNMKGLYDEKQNSEYSIILLVKDKKTSECSYSAILHKIDSLLRLHDTLCDVCNVVNQNYTVQVFISMIVQFGTILFALFYTYWMFAIKPRSSIYWLCWALIKTFEILHITVACHMACYQAKNTSKEVHKLLLINWHKNIKESLMIFSKQLMHRDVEFTVCGFFPIDGTLIFTMVGAASTFIVIMIQFQEAASPTTCYINITEHITP